MLKLTQYVHLANERELLSEDEYKDKILCSFLKGTVDAQFKYILFVIRVLQYCGARQWDIKSVRLKRKKVNLSTDAKIYFYVKSNEHLKIKYKQLFLVLRKTVYCKAYL